MIKYIDVKHYRKLEEICFSFDTDVNFISGTNGTCKSSLLHIISNSFQSVVSKHAHLKDKHCLSIIKAINAGVNLKIESLTKDAKHYKDPARKTKGTLYTVEYINGEKLSFRKHNSKRVERFAVKPHYSRGTKDKLPEAPVIYLGLSRLYPIGEFQNEDDIEKIRYKLPDKYRKEIQEIYQDLTHIEIKSLQPQRMKRIKVRNDFSTKKEGIDGNTISSGEENVFIILTGLMSLKYYFECLPESNNEVESILLIDEFDATLHPSLQIKLLEIIRDFSKKYKIQIISTTHSLSLLKHAFIKKINVIYLYDDIEKVKLMPEPDIYKIEMKLKNISRDSFYLDKHIPVFMEDDEARYFMEHFMDFLEKQDRNFSIVRSRLHFVKANFGAEELQKLFKDEKLSRITHAICILDGDKTGDLTNYSAALPGNKSPECLVFEYAEMLFNNPEDDFWSSSEVIQNNYQREFYRDNIQKDYKNAIESTDKRKLLKVLWNKYKTFVSLVIARWLNDEKNSDEINTFTKNIHVLFFKTSEYHGLNSNDWPDNS